MDLHANAVLTVRQRQRLCDLVATGVTITAAALVVGCSRQTASKWVNRRRRGEPLQDRSSRPHRSPRRTPEVIEQAILRARAELRDVDVKRLGRIVRPGHRVTGDRSKRSQGAGSQYLYVAIDDHSRLAFASVYPDETSDSSTALLEELVGFYGAHGIDVKRVLSDNGACFKRRGAEACGSHGTAVKKTRAYRPQPNGKAERIDFYNRFRPHRALEGLAPLQRVNNLPGTYC